VGTRLSVPIQTGPGAHSASCTMGTGFFPGVKSGRGVTLTPQLLLVPRSRKSRAIPLLPLWAVRHVQSLSACTRVTFTFFHFISDEGLLDECSKEENYLSNRMGGGLLNEDCKSSVQCHVFVHLPPVRHPDGKYSVNH
jgi:hypothetical protein